MHIHSRGSIVAMFFGLVLGASAARAELLPGYTYQFEGLSSRDVCGTPTGVNVRTKLYTYIGANGRDVFLYLDHDTGLRFTTDQLRAGSQTKNFRVGSNRYDATAQMSGDQLSLSMLGTNPRGGQAKYDFRYTMTGTSCQALGFKMEIGGCGNDHKDARPDRCFSYPGRPNTH